MDLALLCSDAVDPVDASALTAHLNAERWDAVVAVAGRLPFATRLACDLRVPLDDAPGDDPAAVVARHPGRRVLLVAGPDDIRSYVAAAVDVDPVGLPEAEPGTITRLRASRGGHLNLMSLNTRLHLDAARSAHPQEAMAGE